MSSLFSTASKDQCIGRVQSSTDLPKWILCLTNFASVEMKKNTPLYSSGHVTTIVKREPKKIVKLNFLEALCYIPSCLSVPEEEYQI